MKNRIFILLLLSAVLMTLLVSGCGVRETVGKIEAAEEAVEQQMDRAEAAVESALQPAKTPFPLPDPAVSAHQAQANALVHAGLSAEQVTGLRTEHERDDGVAHYDVSFCANGFEYEYEIHAETGEILSFDKDN